MRALESTGGNVARASADVLGSDRHEVYRWIEEAGIDVSSMLGKAR